MTSPLFYFPLTPVSLAGRSSALEEENSSTRPTSSLSSPPGCGGGECCGLQWGDINWQERSIHIQRNVVKVTGEDIIVKETKTVAGDRYVYFSLEMESLLKEFQRECAWEAETYDNRKLEDTDYIFRRHRADLPMTPSTFTWRFKLILKKHSLPLDLNVHSLRHTAAQPDDLRRGGCGYGVRAAGTLASFYYAGHLYHAFAKRSGGECGDAGEGGGCKNGFLQLRKDADIL